MKNIYKYHYLFLIIFFGAAAGELFAQKKHDKIISDSSKVISPSTKIIPGRLFNLNENNSTGAVSSVSGETLYKTTTPNLTNTLYGVLPGLTVSQGSGEPGNSNASLAIRGVGTYTFNNLYNHYKVFVDGFEVYTSYIAYLSPLEIESVSILKDAAALAQFGMHGADGVLWIVTKKGTIGKPKVTFSTRAGIQTPTVLNKPLDSYGYANLYNQAISNDKGNVWTPKYSDAQLQAYQNGTGTNVDWYSQVLKKNGFYADGALTLTGGDSTFRYSTILNYANQQGLFNIGNTDTTSNEKFAMYNLRSNLAFKVFKVFDARVDLYTRIEDRKSPNYTTSQLFTDIANYPSNIYPVYDTVGGATNHYSGTTVYPNNPYGSIAALGWRSSRNRYLQANFGLREKLNFITKGLYLDESISFNSYSSVSYNKTKNYARYINGATTTTDLTTSITASSQSPAGQDDWKQAKLLLGYERQFGNHSIISAVEYHESAETGEGEFAYQIHNKNIDGKFNYGYKNKYIGEFGFSYYGSDNFRPGNQWGFYPAISGAWIVSNESFLFNNSTINYFKLRGSVGKTGNSESYTANGTYASNGRYLYQQYYASSGSFYTGNTTPATNGIANPMFIANSNVFAEQSIKYNIGADLVLFRKLSVTVDAYLDKRSKILTLDNSIPYSFGNNVYFNNIGKMTSKGIEAMLTFSNQVRKFSYSLTGIIGYATNVIDYNAEIPTAYSYNATTGRAYGTPIGLVANGFYDIADFNVDGSLKAGQPTPSFGKVQAGDIKYKDLNGDGIVDQTDVTAIGKPSIPKLNYSFNANITYKGFDFSILFQGASGGSVNIWSSANPVIEAFTNNGNVFPIAKGAWAYYPSLGIDTRATATYPRLTTVTNINNYRTSSFWIKSNDYMRIRNAELGYTFSFKPNQGLTKLRLYVNAVNPVTWSQLMKTYNMDPETLSGYPSLKSFNFGFSATF